MHKVDKSFLLAVEAIQSTPRSNPKRAGTIFVNRLDTIAAAAIGILRVMEETGKLSVLLIKLFEARALCPDPQRSTTIFKKRGDLPGFTIHWGFADHADNE